MRTRAVDLLTRGGRHLCHRVPLLLLVSALALVVRARLPPPPPPSVEGVAELLGRAAGAEVEPDAFVWEASGGPLADSILGRNVLFLAAAGLEGARDVFRARVRVTREGRAISSLATFNLSDTPLGDELGLVAHGHHVAYATRYDGEIQGVTVFDLSGHPDGDLSPRARWLWRALRALEAGSPSGLRRITLVLHRPPADVTLELDGHHLLVGTGNEGETAAVALDSGAVDAAAGYAFEPEAWAVPRHVLPVRRALATLVAELWSDARAEALDGWLYGPPARIDTESPGSGAVVAPVAGERSWPPPPVQGDRPWQPPPLALPELDGVVGTSEPYLLSTTVPAGGAEAWLAAIDTRQLELHLRGGYASPRPLTGPPGSGRVPAAARSRVVAAFAGGPVDAPTPGGVVVSGRTLLPIRPGEATVALGQRGEAWLGPWAGAPVLPPEVVSLRQSGTVLLVDGEALPQRGGGRLTSRSALGLTADGYLVYAYAEHAGAATLAAALQRAGCRFAMALAAGDEGVGFTYLTGEGDGELRAHPGVPAMQSTAEQLASASPGDLFYLTLRDVRPSIGGDLLVWEPAEGEHPPPSWLPAVYVAKAERLGAPVTLTAILPDRFAWQIRPGQNERAGRTAKQGLEAASHARAMIAVSLGVAHRRDNRRGLALDGVVHLPIRPDLGVLTADPTGALALGRAVAPMAPPGDATELRLLAEAGVVRVEARTLGARRARSAACMLSDGTLLVGVSRADNTEPAVAALLDAGCRRVLELNRGQQVEAFLHRAGTDTPPLASYPDTVLYGMARHAGGTARPILPAEDAEGS